MWLEHDRTAAPLLRKLSSLVGGQEIEFAEGARGVSGHLHQERSQMRQHPAHGAAVEASGVEAHCQLAPRSDLHHGRQREIRPLHEVELRQLETVGA